MRVFVLLTGDPLSGRIGICSDDKQQGHMACNEETRNQRLSENRCGSTMVVGELRVSETGTGGGAW